MARWGDRIYRSLARPRSTQSSGFRYPSRPSARPVSTANRDSIAALPAGIPQRRLPLPVQIGYATAEIGQNLAETAIRIFLLNYYTDVVGLNPSLAGLAVGLSLLWDALVDPWMGAVSDRTLGRFGGRRGYLPLGGLLLGLGLLLVFRPPALTSQAAKFAWLLFAACFLGTGMSVLSVPYMAMGGEMTDHPHERTVLFGWRFAFANLGGILAVGLPVLFVTPTANNVAAMAPTAVVAAAVVVVTACVSWRATARVPFRQSPIAPTSLWEALREPLGNPAFRPLLWAYVVATLGIGVNSATAVYYYQYRIGLSQQQISTLLGVFLGVFTLSILGWVRLAKRFGKRRAMAVGGLLLGAANSVIYLIAPPGSWLVPLVFGGGGLGLLVGCIVLIDAQLTDVIDHDQVRSNQLRSGLYFGVWRFASKLARALAIAIAGHVLEGVGFVPNEVQTEFVSWMLAVLFGPGVGAFFLASGWILWRYRFGEREQARVRSILERRRSRRPQHPGH